jgi:nucleoside 2-deoxyribosyltransferase
MGLKVYHATPLFSPVGPRVTQMLEHWGHQVFDPLAESKEIWQDRPPADAGPEARRAVLAQNIRGMRWADVVVANLRSTGGNFTDQGVVWELGFSYSLSKPTIGFLAEGEEANNVNLMIAETVDVVVPETRLVIVLADYGAQGVFGLVRHGKALTHEGAS